MDGPKQIEIDQITLEEKCAKSIKSLRKAESKVVREIGKFLKRFDQSQEELKEYKQLVFDSSRNYIQMMNQDSEVVDNKLLVITKEHIKRLEKTIEVQKEISDAIREIEKTYDEYVNNLS